MTSGLISCRMVFVAAKEEGRDRWHPGHDIWRQGAALAPVPIDFSAHDAIAAQAALAKEKVDFCVLDAKLPAAERALILSADRGIRPRPFTVLSGVLNEPMPAGIDLVVPTPLDPRNAFKLVNLCLRTKLPTRALIIDDSNVMRSIIRKVLWGSKFAFDVFEASDGPLGLATLAQCQASLVFLDFNMPGMNGFEVLSEIKRTHPVVGVVMATSSDRSELADRAHQAGVLAFLRKPFYSEDVDVVMDRFYRFHKGAPQKV